MWYLLRRHVSAVKLFFRFIFFPQIYKFLLGPNWFLAETDDAEIIV